MTSPRQYTVQVDTLLFEVGLSDRPSFERLYDDMAPRLYAVCVRVLGPGADADEALQEAFVKVWRHADQWPGVPGSALGWLLAVARHTAIDRRRARHRRARHLDGLASERAMFPVVMATAFATPEETASRISDAQALSDCLDALPQDRAAVIRKAYFTGDSYAEIAEETGRPEGTLKSWVHRSLSALRQCLEGVGVGGAS